jgi:hypothetical protein
MRLRMLAAALAVSSAFGSSNRAAVASPGAAADQPQTSHTTAVSASRRYHAGGRPYSSHYLGRPIYYSPRPMFSWLPLIPDWRDPQDW